jgi:hypothetical protein
MSNRLDVELTDVTKSIVFWNEGAAALEVLFPNTELAAALLKENDRAGVVVAVATDVVKSGLRFPEEKLVTLPPEPRRERA